MRFRIQSDSESNDASSDDDVYYNALIGDEKENTDTLQIFEDLDIFMQITIVSLLTGFVCFLIIVLYIQISQRLNDYKMRKLNVREVDYYFNEQSGMHHHVENDCSDLDDDVEYTVQMTETR